MSIDNDVREDVNPLSNDCDIVFCNYDFGIMTREIAEDVSRNHVYKVIWKVQVCAGGLSGREVLRQVRALRDIEFADDKFDRPPKVGIDYYDHPFATIDYTSFCHD